MFIARERRLRQKVHVFTPSTTMPFFVVKSIL
jgi:hypothetical protein